MTLVVPSLSNESRLKDTNAPANALSVRTVEQRRQVLRRVQGAAAGAVQDLLPAGGPGRHDDPPSAPLTAGKSRRSPIFIETS